MNTDLDRYLKVTAADIQRVAKDYFVPQQATVLIITPAAPADLGECVRTGEEFTRGERLTL